LSAAGHGYTFVPRQFGLVCQIDAPAQPVQRGAHHGVLVLLARDPRRIVELRHGGAGGYNPQPGTVEGWAFGAGGRPGIAPPAAPAPPPPAPKPTTKPAPRTVRPATARAGPAARVGCGRR
jgi:hypothetical protein